MYVYVRLGNTACILFFSFTITYNVCITTALFSRFQIQFLNSYTQRPNVCLPSGPSPRPYMAARGGTISLVLCSVISATVPPVSPWLYLSVISSPAPGVVIGHKLNSSYRIKIYLYSTKMEHKFVCSQNICCVAKNASFSKKGYL